MFPRRIPAVPEARCAALPLQSACQYCYYIPMRENLQKLFACTAFFLCTCCLPLSAGGVQSCRNIYTGLKNAGFSPEYQGLTPSDAALFPQNITIRIAGAKERTRTLVFAFTQEYAEADMDGMVQFIRDLESRELSFPVLVLLSANDGTAGFPAPLANGLHAADTLHAADRLHIHPAGTETFSQAEAAENTCAIVIEESDPGSPAGSHTIIPGGGRDVSPLWLVQALQHAANSAGQQAVIPKTVAFLYRLGLSDEKARVSAFLAQEIPAAGITLAHTEQDFGILLRTASLLERMQGASVWDRHYTYVSIPLLGYEFWVNEAFFASCYLLFAAAVLFMLCFLSFTNSARNKAILADLARTWYLTPLLIAASTAILVLSQHFFLQVPQLAGDSLLLLGAKLLATFTLTLPVFILEARFNFKVSFHAAGYCLLFVAAANIFLFCSIDLTLLFIFVTEYLACMLAQRTKKLGSVAVTLLLLFVPFLPAAANIIFSTNRQSLHDFSACTAAGNALTACILYPLQMQWKRLLIISDIFDPSRPFASRRKLIHTTAFIALSLAALAAIYLAASGFIALTGMSSGRFLPQGAYLMEKVAALSGKILPGSGQPEENSQAAGQETSGESEGSVSGQPPRTAVSVKDEAFMELQLRRISISCPESGTRVLRLEVSAESPAGVPLYDCNYDYRFASRNKVYFCLPDNPAGQVDIVYSCSREADSTITVSVWLAAEDGSISQEIQQIAMRGSEGS